MTKAELIAALGSTPDDAEVLISIKGWDEPLNLTGVERVNVYEYQGPTCPALAILEPSQVGATRLDPNGQE